MKHHLNVISGGLLAGLVVLGSGTALADNDTVRLAHVLPESHSWHQAATGFANEVTERTDGRVKVDRASRYWAGGRMASATLPTMCARL